MEQSKNALFDDDHHGEMPSPSIVMVTLTKTLVAGPSCSVPSTQLPLALALVLLPRGGSQGNHGVDT